VAGNGLVEGLAVGIAAEVEALAPAVLVQVGCKVVVVSCEGCVLVSSLLVLVSICSTAESATHRIPFASPLSPQRRLYRPNA